MTDQADSGGPANRAASAKAEAFRKLHEGPEILILPNAWDVGSAVIFAEAGFPAIATTSSGIAHAQGYPDGETIGRGEMLAIVARIAGKVAVPVSADLERGYGPKPEDVAETVRQAIAAGAVGANFEDNGGRRDQSLLPINEAVERIRAAREAAEAENFPFLLNARTDGFLLGRGESAAIFDDAVRRANAYLAAGAECAFVPGKLDADTLGRLAEAIDGPLNVLGALSGFAGPPLAELQALGIARVSIGGSLSLAALGLVQRVARELRESGTFNYAKDALTNAAVDKMLRG